MSEKEIVEDTVAPTENDEAIEQDKADSKGQKRKKPTKAAEPSKKKSKLHDGEAAVAAENDKDSSQNDTEEDEKAPVALLDRSPEVTGPRVRKQVERLTMNSPAVDESPDRRKNEMLPGRGAKLSTSPRIMAHLQSSKQSDLTLLHRLLYKRVGKAHEIKKNIREFSGFAFTKEDKEFESRKHTLEKAILSDLKNVCLVLDLERSGTKENIVERILDFLLCPNPSTKPVPAKKASKKSKKSSKDKEKKKKSPFKVTGSAKKSSPKKNVTSNETVDDSSSSSSSDSSSSSSSEDEEPDKEEKKKSPPAVKKEKKPVAVASPKATSKENPSASSKSDKKKASPKKSPKKAEIKIKLPTVNKAKKKLESDSEDNKKKEIAAKEEKEKSPPKKSDEPTDAELVKTIKAILKDANLEDMTMKNLCLKVYEKYPKCDLEKTKKDFIRATAKEIIGSGD